MERFVFGGIKITAVDERKVFKKHDLSRIEDVVRNRNLMPSVNFEVKQADFKLISKEMFQKWKWERRLREETIYKGYHDFARIRLHRKSFNDMEQLYEFQCFLWRSLILRMAYGSFVSVQHSSKTLWVLQEEPTVILFDGPLIAKRFWMNRINLEQIQSIDKKIKAVVDAYYQEHRQYPDYFLFSEDSLN